MVLILEISGPDLLPPDYYVKAQGVGIPPQTVVSLISAFVLNVKYIRFVGALFVSFAETLLLHSLCGHFCCRIVLEFQ